MLTHFIRLSIVLFLIPSCITHKPTLTGAPLPQNTSAAPFNPEKMTQLRTFIKENAHTTGMMILHKGEVVFEYGDLTKVSYLASCRKSVLSILYGKHVENGTINLETSIGEVGIDEADGLLDIEKTARIEDVINSRSGVFHVASNGGYDLNNFKERGSKQPGEYFVYSNWDFNVAGHILEHYTQQSVYEELEDQLAIPLGFEDWNLKNQRKSGKKKHSQYPAYHIYLSTRDMAKIGQLMLNKGSWNGQQIISKNWIERTTTPYTTVEEVNDRRGWVHKDFPEMAYSHMWWLIHQFHQNDAFEGAFSATGYGGQFITVLPKLDMVIAHKTKLPLLTLAGITHKDTSDWIYWDMVRQVVEAYQEK